MPEIADLLQPVPSLPTTGQDWLKEAGTFWNRLKAGPRAELVALLDVAARVEREFQYDLGRVLSRAYPGQLSDVAFVSQRQVRLRFSRTAAGDGLIQLPPEVVFLGSILLADGTRLELGRDFLWDDANPQPALRILSHVPLPKQPQAATLELVWWVDSNASRFWSRTMQLDGLPPSDNANLLETLISIGRGAAGEISFRRLLGLIVDVPVVQQLGQVEQVLLDRATPVVVTSAETLYGQAGDTPTVAVGDTVLPGDFVFDSLQFWDCPQSAPPAWLTSLKIPARFFSPYVGGQLEFLNSDQASTVSVVGGRTRLEFPISGNAEDVAAFWEYVERRTGELGYGFAELATGHPQPDAAQVPAAVNPLRLMWMLRLRLGTSVSLIRREPTLRLLRKLGLARRCLPPWLAHIFHFTQQVPEPYDELC